MNICGLRTVILLVLLDWAATDSVEYTGCFIEADYYNDHRWREFRFTDGDYYQKCTEKLHELGRLFTALLPQLYHSTLITTGVWFLRLVI